MDIGIINTLRLNVRYFGVRTIFHPVILASRYLKIQKLDGTVIVHNRSIGAIRIGFGDVGIIDKPYRRSLWSNTGTIEFRGKASLGPATRLAVSGDLIIGNGTAVNANSDIICRKEIIIGDECLISWECLLMDTDFHSVYREDKPDEILNADNGIIIGNHVWIGCRTTVLKGSEIPDDSIVAAGGVVTKCLKKEHTVYRGNDTLYEGINWRE